MTWESRAPRIVALESTHTRDSTTKEAPFGDAEDVLCERRGRILERIVKRCAGLDVHKASVTACVRLATTASEGEEPHQQTRKFPTTTGGLLELRDWLASFEVGLVGMEATGVYWKAVYYMLEDDFECWLLNARHLKGTSPAGRPTSKTPSGSASCSSTGWCAPASCRQKRSGSLGTSPATARGRYKSAPRRSSVLRRCSRRPGSNSPRLQHGCWELRDGRLSRRFLAALPTRRFWRSWPRGACARRSLSSKRPSKGTFLLTTPSWSGTYWPTSTTWRSP